MKPRRWNLHVGASSLCRPQERIARRAINDVRLLAHPLSTYQRSKPKGLPRLGRTAPVVPCHRGFFSIEKPRRCDYGGVSIKGAVNEDSTQANFITIPASPSRLSRVPR
jgi:hypothetical protein